MWTLLTVVSEQNGRLWSSSAKRRRLVQSDEECGPRKDPFTLRAAGTEGWSSSSFEQSVAMNQTACRCLPSVHAVHRHLDGRRVSWMCGQVDSCWVKTADLFPRGRQRRAGVAMSRTLAFDVRSDKICKQVDLVSPRHWPRLGSNIIRNFLEIYRI